MITKKMMTKKEKEIAIREVFYKYYIQKNNISTIEKVLMFIVSQSRFKLEDGIACQIWIGFNKRCCKYLKITERMYEHSIKKLFEMGILKKVKFEDSKKDQYYILVSDLKPYAREF